MRTKYKVFRNKILHTGRINHRIHSGIFFIKNEVQNSIFFKFEKMSFMELVIQIDALVGAGPR
jgi:hypothetical protein